MKNGRSFIKKSGLLLAVYVICFSLFSFSTGNDKPTPARNITITLNVDTGQIKKPDETRYCDFGQDPAISNENYTIDASIGDIITWEGVSSSSENDVVNIVSINHEGGKNVFGENILKGNGQNPEKVVGTVIRKTEGDTYKYKISFTVTNNGVKRNGMFHIDPKILVH